MRGTCPPLNSRRPPQKSHVRVRPKTVVIPVLPLRFRLPWGFLHKCPEMGTNSHLAVPGTWSFRAGGACLGICCGVWGQGSEVLWVKVIWVKAWRCSGSRLGGVLGQGLEVFAIQCWDVRSSLVGSRVLDAGLGSVETMDLAR